MQRTERKNQDLESEVRNMKRFLLCGVLLALLAGCGTAGEQLPEEVTEETEPLSGEELTASAMAAYAEITKDLTFTLDVEEEDATGISLSITPEAARNVAGRENLFSIGYHSPPRIRPRPTPGRSAFPMHP